MAARRAGVAAQQQPRSRTARAAIRNGCMAVSTQWALGLLQQRIRTIASAALQFCWLAAECQQNVSLISPTSVGVQPLLLCCPPVGRPGWDSQKAIAIAAAAAGAACADSFCHAKRSCASQHSAASLTALPTPLVGMSSRREAGCCQEVHDGPFPSLSPSQLIP